MPDEKESGDLVKALKEEAEWTLTQTDNVGSPFYTARIMREAAARIQELEGQIAHNTITLMWQERTFRLQNEVDVLEAENARLREALELITRECDALNKGPVAASIARTALQGEKE